MAEYVGNVHTHHGYLIYQRLNTIENLLLRSFKYGYLDEAHSIKDSSIGGTSLETSLSYTKAYRTCGIMWIDCLPANQSITMSFSLV